jgi:hypothetical protein
MDYEMESVIFSLLIPYFQVNPRDLTYFGIGTFPRVQSLDKFIPELDQLIPVFLKDQIERSTDTIRILLIDPQFDRCMDFLHHYFSSTTYDFDYDDSEGFNRWISGNHRIEIIVINMHMRNTNGFGHHGQPPEIVNVHDTFLRDFTNLTLQNNSKLIVQDYTGADTRDIFKNIYNMTNNKELFKKKILFDITYGENHCHIDLTKEKPIYDPHGDFINIILLNIDELRPLFDYHPKIKAFVKAYYITEYRKIVTVIPVDIRRKVLIESGETIAFCEGATKYHYTLDSPYETLIEILRSELDRIIPVLMEINIIDAEKRDYIYGELLINYRNYTLTSKPRDIYFWGAEFCSLLR